VIGFEKMFLTSIQADEVAAHVAAIEARAGVQVVPALVGKCDTYVELPWKAFALGVSMSALAVVTADARWPEWVTLSTAPVQAALMLGAGAAGALLAIFVPSFARVFLRRTRAELEVRQYARAMFLERQVFMAPGRNGVLVLISLFERRIEILPDIGLRDRVSARDWSAIIELMTPQLRRNQPFHAMRRALAALDELLIARGIHDVPDGNAFSDRAIEERGR
jgi:putative membrane protein